MALTVSAPAGAPIWYVDTGASAHMTASPSTLKFSQPYSGKDQVIVGNGDSLPISHNGSHSITPTLDLLNVLVVPHITKNLLSVSRLINDFPVDVLFSHDSFTIQSRNTGIPMARGKREGGLYVLNRFILLSSLP